MINLIDVQVTLCPVLILNECKDTINETNVHNDGIQAQLFNL